MDPLPDQELAIIEDAKRFCQTGLGIPENGSFTKLRRSKKYYALAASPKDSIRSYFNNPEASASFHNRSECLKESRRLESAGYDIYIAESDVGMDRIGNTITEMPQIGRPFLEQAKLDIITGVIHENIHIYVSINDIDISLDIEEAIACHIQYEGAKILCSGENATLEKIARASSLYSNYFRWCHDNRIRLEQAYSRDFDEGRALLPGMITDHQKNFKATENINNAFFLILQCYERYDEVKEVLKDTPPREILERISRSRTRINNVEDLEKIL